MPEELKICLCLAMIVLIYSTYISIFIIVKYINKNFTFKKEKKLKSCIDKNWIEAYNSACR